MGEPTRREGQVSESGAGAMPEGVEGVAADSAYGDELQAFPRERKSAGTLDLAASQDEPFQLIHYLKIAAAEHLGYTEHEAEWKTLLGYFLRAEQELQKMQDPSHKPAKHGTL